jgi:hypothetical protein
MKPRNNFHGLILGKKREKRNWEIKKLVNPLLTNQIFQGEKGLGFSLFLYFFFSFPMFLVEAAKYHIHGLDGEARLIQGMNH